MAAQLGNAPTAICVAPQAACCRALAFLSSAGSISGDTERRKISTSPAQTSSASLIAQVVASEAQTKPGWSGK